MDIFKKAHKLIAVKFVITMGFVFLTCIVLLRTVFSQYFLLQTNGNMYVENMMIYTPQKLYDLLSFYGPAGRIAYIKSSLFIDFIVPFQYSLFFSSCLNLILTKISSKESILKIVWVFGAVLCLSDWMENVFILTTIIYYPKELLILAIFAECMTILKSTLTVGFITLIVTNLIRIGIPFTKKFLAKMDKG